MVLALVPPAVGRRAVFPEVPASLPQTLEGSDPLARARERARLRARWVQELMARACEEAGSRLNRAGLLRDQSDLHLLTAHELTDALGARRAPSQIQDRVPRKAVAPLPAAFRLSKVGEVMPELSSRESTARGAGGGRAKGTSSTEASSAQAGDVLVVRTLDPDLASVLPGLGGLVSETGSVLSHLAILAREFGIPTVVNVTDAVERFPAGTMVVVDGTSGEVSKLDGEDR